MAQQMTPNQMKQAKVLEAKLRLKLKHVPHTLNFDSFCSSLLFTYLIKSGISSVTTDRCELGSPRLVFVIRTISTRERQSNGENPHPPPPTTQIGSTHSDTDILTIRGRDTLSEIVGEKTFTETFFFIVTGSMPSPWPKTALF